MNWQFLDFNAFKISEYLSCSNWFFSSFTYVPGCAGLHCSAGSSLLWHQGLLSSAGMPASLCSGFSVWGAGPLGCLGFDSCGRGLSGCGCWEHRLSSCATRAWSLHGTWDLPRPGIELVSPTLAGGFFITEPPRKPKNLIVHISNVTLNLTIFPEGYRKISVS